MDLILEIMDTYVLDRVYSTLFPRNQEWPELVSKVLSISNPTFFEGNATLKAVHSYGQPFLLKGSEYINGSIFARDNIYRQFFSLFLITTIFGILLYFSIAGLSYLFVFDKESFNHPKMLKNQMQLEIKQAITSMPFMSILTAFCFVLEIRGYSKMYWDVQQYGTWYMFAQFPLFIMFTDFGIYLIHRGLHHRLVYKTLHKPHHKWIVPTPFASHAFNPIDGFAQSIPYHLFPFLLPLHKVSYVALFIFINIWTIMIHDGEYLSNDPVINGAACHTVHHLYFNYNYGQFTTLWDRIGGSYRTPEPELFSHTLKKDPKTWNKQSKQMEEIAAEVEGTDDRVYLAKEVDKKTK